MGDRLIVACKGTYNGLICFRINEANEWEEEFRKDISPGEPVGLRKSPYGTVMVMIDDAGNRKFLELGWLTKNADFTPDFEREIDLSAYEITAGDFILTWDRTGVRESVLRAYLDEPIIGPESGRLSFTISAEYTAVDRDPDKALVIEKREFQLLDSSGQVQYTNVNDTLSIEFLGGDDLEIDSFDKDDLPTGIYTARTLLYSYNSGEGDYVIQARAEYLNLEIL